MKLSLALVLACLVCVFLGANGRRRDLSEIRYRFTTCGATGRTGPSVEQCHEYYGEAGSILAEGGGLFQFRSMVIQLFNIPTNGLYNFKVAGASGGRGVCNPVRGRGVVVSFQSALSSAHQLLILVGQKGGSPCDKPSNSLDLDFCQDQPLTNNDTLECTEEWFKFVHASYSNYTDAIGGGGGGGASVVWPVIGNAFNTLTPIVVAGGGGGSSAVLGEQEAMRICQNMGINCTERDLSSDAVLSELYQDYTDGRFTLPNDFSVSVQDGTSGTRMNDTVVAGAGGGWNVQRPSDVDGEILNTIILEDNVTARGGFDCTANDAELNLPWSDASGGFGGGGGGCGGGGGGGGFFGGDVLGAGSDIPGRGGSSQVFVRNLICTDPEFEFSDESEDGFIEILPADCNCVHVCMLYEEDDEFECLCPDGTTLAPDGSDCYKLFVSDVEFKERTTTEADFNVVVYGLGTTVLLYSMEATLSGVTSNSDGEQSCAIVFFSTETGSGGNVLLLASNAVKDDDAGVVTTVARVGATSFVYDDFLSSTFRVSGAILLSTGECVIEDLCINMNISIQSNSSISEELELEDEEYHNIIQTFNDRSVPRIILRIGPRSSAPATTDPTSANIGPGATAGLIIAGLVVCVLIFLIVIMICFIKRRGTIKSADLTNPHSEYSQSLPQCSFNAAYLTLKDEDADKPTNEAVGFGKEVVSENSDHSAVTEEQAQPVDNIVAVSSQCTTKISASFNIPRGSLNITGELGQGEFGIVYRAVMDSKHVVAVKTVKGIHSQEMVDSMLQECAKMQRFRHPNVMPLIGVCLDGGPTPLIVMPYMVNGSLLDYLRKERTRLVHTPAGDSDAEERVFLAQKQMVDICLQVAKGMEYLVSKKIVHRDLAARNCMINFNFVIKVADFGLAESIYSKTYFRRDEQRKKSEKLPLKWLAPECIEDGVFTEKTDVWSFGVTCWEVFSGGIQPYPGFDPRSLYEFLRNGHRMNKPDNSACSDDMYAIMAMCWESDPKQRPDFSRLIRAISNSLEATTDYLKLTLEESMTTVKSPFVDKVDQRFIVPRCCLDMTDIPIGTAGPGPGSFGETFKATVRKNEDVVEIVAVKVMNDGADSQEVVDAVLKESAKMQRFRHPNVMPLIGVCLDGGPTPLIVMPYMVNGSLLDYLRKERASLVHNTAANQELITLAELRMMDMCLQVAMGMEYLVSNSIVHRGLAARNCMIDYNFVIKVSDFSLSENMYTKAYFRPDHHKSRLPLKWLAPDVLNNRIFSEKTDIWAYGVTCWEVFSGGEVPYRGVEARSLLPLLQQGHRLEKPANAACSDYAYSMMKQCWLATPEERPTFSELVTSTAPLLRTSSVYNREELETATL